jgi:hypothetical protein
MELLKNRPDGFDAHDQICGMTGCGKPPAFRVAMMLFPPLGIDAEIHMLAETKLEICADHGETIKFDDVVGDEGWTQLSDAIHATGKLRPARHRCRLKLIPILKLEKGGGREDAPETLAPDDRGL